MNDTANTPFAPGMAEVLAEEARLTALEDPAATAAFWAEGTPDVPVEDLSYPGAEGQPQAARLYRGAAPAPAPVLIFAHGGGWVGGSIALNEAACRALAADSGWSVLSISYRLAPAYPFPAGLEDVKAALRWLGQDGAGPLGLDPARIALGGASAGANLAMATALSIPGAAQGLLLYYGVYDRDTTRPSFAEHDASPGITTARVREIFDLYAPGAGTDPLVVPFHAPDLSVLPPACLIAAEMDVLRSENEAMAARMRAAGCDVDFHVEPGVHHGFINRGRLLPAARSCLSRGADFLNRLSGMPV
ncbi:alpha/beta hydrolase [Psychromarinibacter sp. C21-152]|uniref:Alpha/beta hydrolase n=1 Tax=Psychromarinibacter sediminicola TaxID=3033385 RepID=A0AAE3NWT8_9RHOB|nr:alpha/beta hydrolase [Psychromarinibacter sediminicola]MDF0603741.1 alpha/beta hydrolase [Psychromarinibacter sediminicola]